MRPLSAFHEGSVQRPANSEPNRTVPHWPPGSLGYGRASASNSPSPTALAPTSVPCAHSIREGTAPTMKDRDGFPITPDDIKRVPCSPRTWSAAHLAGATGVQ